MTRLEMITAEMQNLELDIFMSNRRMALQYGSFDKAPRREQKEHEKSLQKWDDFKRKRDILKIAK